MPVSVRGIVLINCFRIELTMKYFKSIKTGITKFNYMLAIFGALVVVITMFIMTADVTARAFKWPLLGAVELSEIAMGLMVFLGWAYTQQQKRHITIDILYVHYPNWAQRILNVFNPVIGVVFMLIVAWLAYDFAMYSKISTETTENLALPVWPFKLSVFVGAITFCLQLIFELVDAIRNYWAR